eukprot:PhF_6_TR26031/c0_g1_i1/m.36664
MTGKQFTRPVRRARKSQLDRRVRRMQEDLDTNLMKVENRLFTQKRTVIATKVYIPDEIRKGVITPELKELEEKFYGKQPEIVEKSKYRKYALGMLTIQAIAAAVR